MPYKITPLNFNLVSAKLDYFQVLDTYFNPVAQKQNINLLPGEYLNRTKHFTQLDLDKKETVVLNFQVGKGKTTLCYDLMEEYEKKGYYVIVCSPFKRLVQKDFQELDSRIFKNRKSKFFASIKSPKVFSYEKISEEFINDWKLFETAPYDFPVHIMTINTFMSNPGDKALKIGYEKSEYIKALWNATVNKKVVLFLDEVHESVHNFQPELIPNILKWMGTIEKIFISSATFTPATIPLIKAFSMLTDKVVSIFESPRIKNLTQSNIFLHLCSFPIHAKEISLMYHIKRLAEQYNKAHKPINIITATKLLAETLANFCYSPAKVVDDVSKADSNHSLDHINLLTSDTNVPYSPGKNNIGTTFKAGVNMSSAKETLFVIFPTIKQNNKNQFYSNFSDGISSIIQSIGRQRNGGDIHLIMYEPEIFLGDTQDYPAEYSTAESISHLKINKSWDYVKKDFRNILKANSNEILFMESAINQNPMTLLQRKQQLAFHFYNEHEYILKKSQQLLLVHKNPSFGYLLSPYIFWACINNQFINGTLKKVYRHEKSNSIKLTSKNVEKQFLKILRSREVEIKQSSFRSSLQEISKNLSLIKDQNGNIAEVKFSYEGKGSTAPVLLNRNKILNQIAVKSLYKIFDEPNVFPDDRSVYIRRCLQEIDQLKTLNPLHNAYKEFADGSKVFRNFIVANTTLQNDKSYIKRDLYKDFPDLMYDASVKAIQEIKDSDKILKVDVISFMQNFNYSGSDSDKKKVFTLFSELSFKTGGRKMIEGVGYIEIQELPVITNGINLL